MLYIPRIGGYLKVLIDDKVKDFLVMNFDEYFQSSREKLYSKLSEVGNLRKVAELLYIFLPTPDEVEKHVEMMHSSFPDNCICLSNFLTSRF